MGLRLRDISVRYGRLTAVDRVDIDAAAGEIVALVGPSGCGKSSLLRAVAGLVPSSGSLHGPKGEIGRLPSHRRGVGVVFQDHALFPHLNVGANVAFGLVEQGLPAAERRQRVQDWLARIGLADRERDAVDQLSGGERQRVALARALAPEPGILLLDEPFASLDQGLRQRLSQEVSELARQQSAATLFVTHDLDEALAVTDRVAVMRAGRVLQVAEPAQLMAAPASPWIARFLGHQNVWEGAAAEGLPGKPAAAMLLSERLSWQTGDTGQGQTATVAVELLAQQRLREGWRLRLAIPAWRVELSWLSLARDWSHGEPPPVGSPGRMRVPEQAWVRWSATEASS